jgi:hypothetical protein
MQKVLSKKVGAFRNSFAGAEALEDDSGSARQQAKGPVDRAHVGNPAEQRGEVVLGGPGEVGIHYLLDSRLVDGSLGAYL